MFVGVQGIGKTSLLNELRKYGKTETKKKNDKRYMQVFIGWCFLKEMFKGSSIFQFKLFRSHVLYVVSKKML